MIFSDQISRLPRAYDIELGRQAAAPWVDNTTIHELIAATAGSSPYLRSLIITHRDWLERALNAPVDRVRAGFFEQITYSNPRLGLRQAKARMALYVALADLAGVWGLDEVTQTLSDFADFACAHALSDALRHQFTKGKLPSEDACELGVFLLAMGKMGAGELNYSSDIDLICLFDDQRHAKSDLAEIRAGLVRAIRMMTATLSDVRDGGYVFRTDLRLRPNPAVTPVIMSMSQAQHYYETLGRTWERSAHIKARPAAGDLSAGNAYLDRLMPFVWRMHLDFAAIQDMLDMRGKLHDHKEMGSLQTLDGRDVKLSPGGIRDIEFFVQTRQLIAGGRDEDLRRRASAQALSALAEKGWMPAEDACALRAHLTELREIEHRLQMINDAQTHMLPRNAQGWGQLAGLCGADLKPLKHKINACMQGVREITGALYKSAPRTSAAKRQAIPTSWYDLPALRSARSRELFESVAPRLATRLDKCADPATATSHIESFLQGMPAGVQFWSLFHANPQLVDLLVDIADSAPEMARYLGRNAAVFDRVVEEGFFEALPDCTTWTRSLTRALQKAPDYEMQLYNARAWMREERFRIGVHHIRGQITAAEAGHAYADLAKSVVQALYPIVCDEFARKHGPPPGLGAMVLGMGSLGARAMTVASDLDLIMIYDSQGRESSAGARPLETRPYYARLTQALVTALRAPMGTGKLYDVDFRLRPSGRQGPVATAWRSFQDYQRDQAWTWEHLALTRARPIAGPAELCERVEAFRREIIARPRDINAARADVVEMRERINAARTKPVPDWDMHAAKGGLKDIELIAALFALENGSSAQDPALQLPHAHPLIALHRRFAAVRQVSHLIAGKALTAAPKAGAAAFMLRDTGADTTERLSTELAAQLRLSAAYVTEILNQRD